MRVFDYSFLNNGLLPASLVNLTSGIVSLKTMAGVRKDEYAGIFTELESIAKVQAIEGIVTSDERINAIVNQNSAPLNHNEAEIAGYRDALNAIHMGYEYMDFRQSDILRLHEMLMSIAGYEYGGQYKADDNVILEVDTNGRQRVRFRPVPASETPEAMEQLELAYLAARTVSILFGMEMAACHACSLCFFFIKTAMMPENMSPLRNRSVTIKLIIMKLCGSLLKAGKKMKTAIFHL